MKVIALQYNIRDIVLQGYIKLACDLRMVRWQLKESHSRRLRKHFHMKLLVKLEKNPKPLYIKCKR